MIIPQLTSDTLSWLLQGDPSVSWQVQRDLIGEKPAVYNQTRSRIHQEGWGKDLLSHQDPTGSWGGWPVWSQMDLHSLHPDLPDQIRISARQSSSPDRLPVVSGKTILPDRWWYQRPCRFCQRSNQRYLCHWHGAEFPVIFQVL